MQNTAHIIAFYAHKSRNLRQPMAALAIYTLMHDMYLVEHDRSVSDYVDAQR